MEEGGEEERHPRPNFQAVYYQGEAQEVPRMRTTAVSGSLSASSSVAAPMRMRARPPFINGSLFGSSRLTSPQARLKLKGPARNRKSAFYLPGTRRE